MARAEAASASARPDSIKGLAQSLAKPAYRRLLNAEPALRRAVPALIIAFLITICIGAAVQVMDHRRHALAAAAIDLEAVAEILTDRLAPDKMTDNERAEDVLRRALPSWATAGNRHVFVTNSDGRIIAGLLPARGLLGRALPDILGPDRPSMPFSAGVLQVTLADGSAALAIVRPLRPPYGQLAVVQRRGDALAVWRSDTALTITLSATTGFVVLILGFAFHWQATRAREADIMYEAVRSRIDTALNRGRCGLWDWDLARGRIFWSHSMFAILGLTPKDDLLTFGEVSTLVHPDDIKLYDLATQLADAKAHSVDHAFRMRHADGHWIWLRARCELVRQRGEPGDHLIGIAVDITEQKNLVERTLAADLRLRDAV